MENNEEIKKEDRIDIKSALSKLVDEEPKKLSQEEAINNYTENKKKKKYSTSSEDSESNQEEEEHLKRVKQELLSSLKRVDLLAKKIFIDKELKTKNVAKMKIDSTMSKSPKIKTNQYEVKENVTKNKDANEERTIE